MTGAIGPNTPQGRRAGTPHTISPPGGDHWPRTHWPAAGDRPSSTSRKLITVKRTADKGTKRATTTVGEKAITSRRARSGAVKITRPSVVVGWGSRDPESIGSDPRPECVQSEDRRASAEQV